jgi:hypothetical protein
MKEKQQNKPDDKINYFKELILTFSNKKSFFSSKRIERFIVFNVFLVLTVVYVVRNIEDLDSFGFIQIVGLWLAYGGYNSLMNLRDRKFEAITPPPPSDQEHIG